MAKLEKQRSIQLQCLEYLLAPLVRFCLRNAYSFQDFLNVAKIVFVNVAGEEIGKTTKKVNVSRISAMTGIYRDEVKRIREDDEGGYSGEPLSVLARVMGQWEQDPRFTTKNGQPRVLSYQGEESEFEELAYSVSKHLNLGTVLFELERMGAVEKTTRGLKLVRSQMAGGTDPLKRFETLGADVEALLAMGEENIFYPSRYPNLHLHTEYDNVFLKDLPKIRQWLVKEGKVFHRKARDYISKFDKDIRPNPKEEAGGKVVLTAFGITTIPGTNPNPSEE